MEVASLYTCGVASSISLAEFPRHHHSLRPSEAPLTTRSASLALRAPWPLGFASCFLGNPRCATIATPLHKLGDI